MHDKWKVLNTPWSHRVISLCMYFVPQHASNSLHLTNRGNRMTDRGWLKSTPCIFMKAYMPHKRNFKPTITLINQIIFIVYIVHQRHIIAYLSLDQCCEAIFVMLIMKQLQWLIDVLNLVQNSILYSKELVLMHLPVVIIYMLTVDIQAVWCFPYAS